MWEGLGGVGVVKTGQDLILVFSMFGRKALLNVVECDVKLLEYYFKVIKVQVTSPVAGTDDGVERSESAYMHETRL